jgi:hypothetical protein
MAFLDVPEVQIYFLTRAKDGAATLQVCHEWALQRMYLPLHPHSAVPAALPLLEPAIAHYVAQWPRYMVPDVNEADDRGFTVPAGGMPNQIAPPENWDALSVVAWQHMPARVDEWLDGMLHLPAISKIDPAWERPSYYEAFLVEPADLGIDLWPP